MGHVVRLFKWGVENELVPAAVYQALATVSGFRKGRTEAPVFGDVWAYRPESHKTEHHGRERIIHIGPKGQAILSPYLLHEADASAFSPADSERKRRAEQRAQRKTKIQPSQVERSKAKPKTKAGGRYTTLFARFAGVMSRAGRPMALVSPAPRSSVGRPGSNESRWSYE